MMTKAPFEAVVADHGATVLRVCRAVLGSHTDAEDAWSETFLSALKAYLELPAEANVRGWLVTIAHRKAIDVTRARARHAIPTADLPERAGSDLEPPDAAVWRAVRSLPPRQREVITYRYLGGLDYATIAELTGGTAAAARRAASDGLTSLRAKGAAVTLGIDE